MERWWCLVGGIDEVGMVGGLVRYGGFGEYREGVNRMLLGLNRMLLGEWLW
jgi:hypothetical protein